MGAPLSTVWDTQNGSATAACRGTKPRLTRKRPGDFMMAELVTKADLLAVKQELQTELRSTRQELQTELRTGIAELHSKIDTQTLRLTVRLGAMLAVAIGALATILKLA